MRVLFLFFLTTQISAQNWTLLSSFPGIACDDGVAVEVEGKAYVGTGLQTGWVLAGDFFVMDLSSHTWSTIASMPAGTERQYACAFRGPSAIYVFGGDGSAGVLNTLYKYHIHSNTWTQMASKPGAGVYGASMMAFGDKILLLGGRFSNANVNQEVWEYSISNNAWTQKSNMPAAYEGRWMACATTFNGKGYYLYGVDNTINFRTEFLEYDPQTDSWQMLSPPASTPSRAYASLESLNNQLILFGGVDSLNVYYTTVSYYHPASNTWSPGQNLPANARRGGMSWTKDNRYYYTCGLDDNSVRLNETWILDVPLGFEENEIKRMFQIGPNPIKNRLLIYSNQIQNQYTIGIFDAFGQRQINAKEYEYSEYGINVNTEQLKSGLYFLEIQMEGSIPVRWKVIKE
ncbi:MAG: T9SS type A sorting domain-containing protein [Bacteroidia bacterium]|jgi:N-acetylneuraminic acid mutarotase|nr:T9SS type A sorting domain-containing protein [Bacteroidia bacterium]